MTVRKTPQADQNLGMADVVILSSSDSSPMKSSAASLSPEFGTGSTPRPGFSPRAPRYSPVAPPAQGQALGGFPRQDDPRQALNSRRRLDQELAAARCTEKGASAGRFDLRDSSLESEAEDLTSSPGSINPYPDARPQLCIHSKVASMKNGAAVSRFFFYHFVTSKLVPCSYLHRNDDVKPRPADIPR